MNVDGEGKHDTVETCQPSNEQNNLEQAKRQHGKETWLFGKLRCFLRAVDVTLKVTETTEEEEFDLYWYTEYIAKENFCE